MRTLNFGVLVSSEAHDHGADEIDLRSGLDLLRTLHGLGLAAKLIPVGPDIDVVLRTNRVDACLLALHGQHGGSGEIQTLLQMKEISFVGAPTASVIRAYDKLLSRKQLSFCNLPVPTTVAISPESPVDKLGIERLGWPCIVKPRLGSHSRGHRHLGQPKAVSAFLETAELCEQELVVERAVDGFEVQVVVLRGEVLGAMQLERDPNGDMLMTCPPRLSTARLDGLGHLASRAVEALGLEQTVARVDIMVSDRHNEAILEVEPLPSLERTGVVSRVARAAGLSHEQLVATLLRDILDISPRAPAPSARTEAQAVAWAPPAPSASPSLDLVAAPL